MSRKNIITLIAVVAVIVIIVIASRPPKVTVTQAQLKIGGLYGAEISTSEITAVELLDSIPKILNRPNGINVPGFLLKGSFVLEEWGKGKLHVRQSEGPYLLIDYKDTFYLLRLSTLEKTQELYNSVVEKIN